MSTGPRGMLFPLRHTNSAFWRWGWAPLASERLYIIRDVALSEGECLFASIPFPNIGTNLYHQQRGTVDDW